MEGVAVQTYRDEVIFYDAVICFDVSSITFDVKIVFAEVAFDFSMIFCNSSCAGKTFDFLMGYTRGNGNV